MKTSGPKHRLALANEFRRFVVLHIQFGQTSDKLNMVRAANPKWRLAVATSRSVVEEVEILNELGEGDSSKISRLEDFASVKEELELAVAYDKLFCDPKDSFERLQLLTYKATGVLTDHYLQDSPQLTAFAETIDISPHRIRYLLEDFAIETSLSTPKDMTKGLHKLEKLNAVLKENQELEKARLTKEQIQQIDLTVTLDYVHYLADAYDQVVTEYNDENKNGAGDGSEEELKTINFSTAPFHEKIGFIVKSITMIHLIFKAQKKEDVEDRASPILKKAEKMLGMFNITEKDQDGIEKEEEEEEEKEEENTFKVGGKYILHEGTGTDRLRNLLYLKAGETEEQKLESLKGLYEEAISEFAALWRSTPKILEEGQSKAMDILNEFFTNEWAKAIQQLNNTETQSKGTDARKWMIEVRDIDFLFFCGVVLERLNGDHKQATFLGAWFKSLLLYEDGTPILTQDKLAAIILALAKEVNSGYLTRKHMMEDMEANEPMKNYCLRLNLAKLLHNKYEAFLREAATVPKLLEGGLEIDESLKKAHSLLVEIGNSQDKLSRACALVRSNPAILTTAIQAHLTKIQEKRSKQGLITGQK